MSDDTNRTDLDSGVLIVDAQLSDGTLMELKTVRHIPFSVIRARMERRKLANAPFPPIQIAEGATILDYPTVKQPLHRITINGWTATYGSTFNGNCHLKAHSGMVWSGNRQLRAATRSISAVMVEGRVTPIAIAKKPDLETLDNKSSRSGAIVASHHGRGGTGFGPKFIPTPD